MVSLLLGENLALALLGAIIGVALAFAVTSGLEQLPALKGVLHANYTPSAFWRALYTALAMTLDRRAVSGHPCRPAVTVEGAQL